MALGRLHSSLTLVKSNAVSQHLDGVRPCSVGTFRNTVLRADVVAAGGRVVTSQGLGSEVAALPGDVENEGGAVKRTNWNGEVAKDSSARRDVDGHRDVCTRFGGRGSC